jgi:Tfp pilus assembly protein PilF
MSLPRFCLYAAILVPIDGTVACASAPDGAHASASAAPVVRADENIDVLITRGRAALDAGRAADAQRIFEEAASKDSDSLRTRVWVLRSWIAQGRINDALNATDEMSRAGAKGPEIDYLYGTAFALIARKHIEQQNGSGLVEMNLRDAIAYLDKATKADPERFSDAFALLAESAWHAQDLDVARAAAEKAVALQPKSVEASLMLGRVALAQYSALAGDASQSAAADKNWETARAALQRAIDLSGDPKDPESRTTLAKIHIDLGHALKWKDKNDEATKEYSAALGLDPSVANFQQLLGALGKERFLSALEAGAKAFAEKNGAESKGDAALLWWLGWARFDQKQYAKADEALSLAVKKDPSFFNSWYYIALSRYYQQNYDGAILALRRNFEDNALDLVASINGNAELNLKILDYLIGMCAQKQRNLEAAILSEIETLAVPTDADYWNNTGLFYRDAGAALRGSDNDDDKNLAKTYFEKAYAAYTKALELMPENPALLNDTAVMLHYYLDRDSDKAKAMYKKAAELAEAELKREDLTPEVRTRDETALRDSKNNLAKLERGDKREG